MEKNILIRVFVISVTHKNRHVMTYISKDIEIAIALLKNDQVIAIPTETVYGLAGNALNPSVVNKIYEIKNRPLNNPLIIYLPDTTQIYKYVKNIPAIAEKLAAYFWPGPLTLLLPKNDIIPDIVTAGLPNVAIRIPSHPFAIQLLRKLPFPLAALSANPFAHISSTSAEDVKKMLFGKIPYILDGGPCTKGIESTIVGFDDDMPIIYRVGVITSEAIKSVTGKVEINQMKIQNPLSPGMLPSHYAPHTSLFLTNNVAALLKKLPHNGTGILAFKNPYLFIPENNQEVLSETGNLDEAAHNLYKALLRLDSLELERIVAERIPYIGIGVAINDRLERAANK
jgi:L-threonylcarbamoyladenylate synthase